MNITTTTTITMEKLKTANICLKSHAKINLFLDVRKKRNDGYSEIVTIFSKIDLFDTLNFVLTKKTTIQILTNKDFVNVEDNLIYKVAIFIKKKYNVKFGVKIELEKKIPIAAGLGGGSSNCATTIIGLSKLWNLNLTEKEMHDIAKQFGSDINFFLQNNTAIGTGRGEIIQPIDSIDIDNIFLVNPGFGISSKEAYQIVDLSEKSNSSFQEFLKFRDIRFSYNRLEKEIRKKYSEIDSIINFLNTNGASKAILSGSGATIIGFCPNYDTAKSFSIHYSKKNYWNCITKTIRSTK